MSVANVLFVDDEVPFVEAMSRRLKKRDISIVTSFSGLEALDVLEKDRNVEVVILDVKMPGMDGIETLGEIRKRFPLVEVVMLTGHATVETGIEGMKLGAFDYLMKPCDMDVLMDKLKEAVAKKRKHEEKIIEARVKAITTRRA
ncbi:MAG: response regulator [Deltaproteobacteria bacterium]|jgi:DNA-binding NtrC family response regulator|nr:response regulator [Deltaproteobacteria bacterium]